MLPTDQATQPTRTLPDIDQMLEMMEVRWNNLKRERALHWANVAVGLRFNVFMRDEFRCRYCGQSASDGAILEVDHVVPRSKGGRDEMSNLVTACWDCNRGKSDKQGVDNLMA